MYSLTNPKVPFENKKQIINRVFKGIKPTAINFLYFLVTRERLGIFDKTLEEYRRLVDQHNGIEHAEIVTAFPLSGKEKNRLAESMTKSLGKKKVVLDTREDPAIIGGLVARIGDKLLDGSTRKRLENLKKSLVSGTA